MNKEQLNKLKLLNERLDEIERMISARKQPVPFESADGSIHFHIVFPKHPTMEELQEEKERIIREIGIIENKRDTKVSLLIIVVAAAAAITLAVV